MVTGPEARATISNRQRAAPTGRRRQPPNITHGHPGKPRPPAHARPVLITGARGFRQHDHGRATRPPRGGALVLPRDRERGRPELTNLRSATGQNSGTRIRAVSLLRHDSWPPASLGRDRGQVQRPRDRRGAHRASLRGRAAPWWAAWPLSQFLSHSSPSGTVRRCPPRSSLCSSRTVADAGERGPALLESVLGATPQEFESPILRRADLRQHR